MARKNKNKRGGASGAELQERRQRQLEERRRQKAEALREQQRRQRRERLVRTSLILLLVAGLVWFIFLRQNRPTEINGRPIESFSSTGVNSHQEGDLSYESTPAVSGTHDPQPGVCGVFAESIPDETQVHMLEHGAVGIQYKPDLNPEQIKQIEELVTREGDFVFSAPYEGMETPIAVSSWSRLMRLDTLDIEAIQEYVDEFGGQPPETGGTCPAQADDPFEPEAEATPSPPAEPSPEPEPSPDEEKSSP